MVVSESVHDTNTLFAAGLVCVINGLRPESFSKKITCFLTLKTTPAFQPKMGLFGGEIIPIFNTKKDLLRF